MAEITEAAVAAQEAAFARAFAAGDVGLARALYDPAVVYLSPTVRLFGWPARIEGVERTLDFIALTIARCRDIAYAAVESVVVRERTVAWVRIHFDWTADDGRRLRSDYVVRYAYRAGRIVEQRLWYDPSGALEELDPRA
jgi:ketosteroid isomerase-like protein